jgi:hypothetical protein
MGADGYEELEVPGDGSCLFHAVLTAYFAQKKGRLPVYADPRKLHETSLKLRERAVHHVLRHYDKPLGDGFDTGKDLIMLEYGSSEGDPLGPPIRDPVQYLKHMRHPTTFRRQHRDRRTLPDTALDHHGSAGRGARPSLPLPATRSHHPRPFRPLLQALHPSREARQVTSGRPFDSSLLILTSNSSSACQSPIGAFQKVPDSAL